MLCFLPSITTTKSHHHTPNRSGHLQTYPISLFTLEEIVDPKRRHLSDFSLLHYSLTRTMATTAAHRPSQKPLDLKITIVYAKHLKNVNWRRVGSKPIRHLLARPRSPSCQKNMMTPTPPNLSGTNDSSFLSPPLCPSPS
ncbi:hypothetical protein LXL04_020723 [Taraxacum kok-saghyz]